MSIWLFFVHSFVWLIIFNQLMLILWLGWSVCMYVSMYIWKYVCHTSRLAFFICISGTILWKLIKLCMNINLWYAVILPFHDLHLRGKKKCGICINISSFICISGSIFWNFTKLCMNVNIEYAVILPFHDFHLRGKTNVAYV